MSNKKLSPHSRKATYHALGEVIGDFRNKESTVSNAMVIIKASNAMQNILQFNLAEYKAKREEPAKYPDFKMKEIEKDFD
ncbi:MAG: hypothetical protein AB2L20_11895 [Mangrovibacterium sp.]